VSGSPARIFSSRQHYENFPVASVLLPAAMRPHVAAVYAFARTADDFADEGAWPAGERHRLLDGWARRLRDAASGALTPGPPPDEGEPADTVAIFDALGRTIREKALPLGLFEDLLSAFRQDVTVHRYATWTDLLDYCRRSANPVGRLVLRIAGYRDVQLDRWSDAVCSGLQLVNFWQDLMIDFRRGRIYLPADDLRRHGATEGDLGTGRITPAWRAALADVVLRTRSLLHEGRPVCDAVGGRLRYELRATWLGGVRILDRLESGSFDVAARRPVLGAADLPWFVGRIASWGFGAGMP
jgi:squalene synthase HpnC